MILLQFWAILVVLVILVVRISKYSFSISNSTILSTNSTILPILNTNSILNNSQNQSLILKISSQISQNNSEKISSQKPSNLDKKINQTLK